MLSVILNIRQVSKHMAMGAFHAILCAIEVRFQPFHMTSRIKSQQTLD